MANENAVHDANRRKVMLAVDDTTGETVQVPTDADGNIRIAATLADATVPDGGTGVTSFTAYAPIFGGTTATGALQSGTVGTTGQVLTSNGAGSLPTFQSVGSGTVTSVSVATANGFSGTVATATTTPAITIIAGAITPTSVNGLTISTTTGTLTLTNAKTLTVLKTISFTAADDTGVYTLPTGTKTLVATDVATLSSLTAVSTLVTGNATAIVDAASTTVAGKIEVATSAETTSGTDATRAVSPDGFAGSDYGIRFVEVQVLEGATNTAVVDGVGNYRFFVPAQLNGYNLVVAHAAVVTAGTTNTTTIQIANVTDAVDMLSTKITIDSAEKTSYTAATPPVIDATKDDVATGDELRIDCDAISTTPAKGLIVILGFQLP